ncbi:MAG: RelA/SpoT family protein [Burkholderiaceae bacterium]
MANHPSQTTPAVSEARARQLALARLGGDEAGRAVLEHAQGTARVLSELQADEAARAAAWLFGSPESLPTEEVQAVFGSEVGRLVASMRTLRRLQELTRDRGEQPVRRAREQAGRAETLRRMLLALSVDVRVVLLRLASRLQTLRRAAATREPPAERLSQETLDLLAPLANRLGIAQIKWELEDLAFRFLEPERYHEIARDLKETRKSRQAAIDAAVGRLREALAAELPAASIEGRPKHIYSIFKKMQAKALTLADLHDLLAVRVIVRTEAECYAVLARVHALWTPVASEFDDYIRRPKPNGYQSLHTVVVLDAERRLEVQIRTRDMHEAAEYGVASHWRYKEGAAGMVDAGGFDERVAWVRQLLRWQREVGQALGVGSEASGLDEPVYALTPEARIIALPPGATPIDFAYHVHTELGHICRGARVDGQLVPLNTPLRSGQTVEIVSARRGDASGPSRDWLRPDSGYLASNRARQKVRQWFAQQDAERDQTDGRAILERLLQRLGATRFGHDTLANRVGLADAAALYGALAHAEIGPRAIERAVQPEADPEPDDDVPAAAAAGRRRTSDAGAADRGILVAGVDALMHHLARCCHPVPPEPIAGYVTTGHGVTIHRRECSVLANLRRRSPERVVAVQWPAPARESERARFDARLQVRAAYRPGLNGDLGEILAREQVPMVRAQSHRIGDESVITMVVALRNADSLRQVVRRLAQVPGVSSVVRR